jgi:hypothetical protein
LEAGFLSLAGTEEPPPERWQFSMSAISPDWPWSAERSWFEDASTIAGELARAGGVQPMRQARTAIHRETPVAVPAFTMCKVERIPAYIVRLQPQKHSDSSREDISRAVKRANLAKQNWWEGAKKFPRLIWENQGPRVRSRHPGHPAKRQDACLPASLQQDRRESVR